MERVIELYVIFFVFFIQYGATTPITYVTLVYSVEGIMLV